MAYSALTAIGIELPVLPPAAPAPSQDTPLPVSLRVSGGKPLRISAVTVAEGNSWCLGTHAWHEVRVLRRDTAEYVVAITCFKKSAGEADIFHAELFPTLEEALSYLEAFDPTIDLNVDIDAADHAISGAHIALKAAALRQRTDAVARQWRALIGEMLFRLDLAD